MNGPSPEQILRDTHKQWLNNPVTQQALKLLSDRHESFKKSLHDSAERETDVSFQGTLRANISCIKAVTALLTDTEIFVQKSITKSSTH